MNKIKKRTVLKQYLLQYLFQFSILFGIFIIFYTVTTLYNVSTEAVEYAFILSFFLLLIILLLHFILYYQKHVKIIRIKNYITTSISDLPNPSSLIEEDYQKLLTSLFNAYHSASRNHELKRQELLDYYSLWVHQIKTPIAAMKLLLETDSQNHNEELLELQRIGQYVDMALQFLRLESMSSDLVLKSYDLDILIKDTVKKQASFFITKKIQLQLQPLNTTIITDEKWFKFVIEQILSNSLKYTNSGSISISIDPTNPYILIIEDTGIGIKEEDLPKVFHKGFTGYNGRTNYESTGIGLYLCKQIMNNLHHEISISSKIDVGTKVMINFEQVKTIYE